MNPSYLLMLERLTGVIERNEWIIWAVAMLPLIPAVAFRSAITMFAVMAILAVSLLLLPGYTAAAYWLWTAALVVSTLGGAYHFRYRQAERHHAEMIAAIRGNRSTVIRSES
jgi:membrane protein implicated in regulation of membrane protease activity